MSTLSPGERQGDAHFQPLSRSRSDCQNPPLSTLALNQTRPDRDGRLYSTPRCSIPNHAHETCCMTQKFSAKNGEDTNQRSTLCASLNRSFQLRYSLSDVARYCQFCQRTFHSLTCHSVRKHHPLNNFSKKWLWNTECNLLSRLLFLEGQRWIPSFRPSIWCN